MADRHRDPTVTVRPTEQVKTTAANALAEHGWTLQAYLLACLAELLADPAKRVREIEPYRPEPKPIGRPPKTQPPRRST